MSEIDSPACPHCGSLRVTTVRAPQLISGSSAGPVLQTHNHAWQCICGAVFTVSPAPTADRDDFTSSDVPMTDQLRRNKPR